MSTSKLSVPNKPISIKQSVGSQLYLSKLFHDISIITLLHILPILFLFISPAFLHHTSHLPANAHPPCTKTRSSCSIRLRSSVARCQAAFTTQTMRSMTAPFLPRCKSCDMVRFHSLGGHGEPMGFRMDPRVNGGLWLGTSGKINLTWSFLATLQSSHSWLWFSRHIYSLYFVYLLNMVKVEFPENHVWVLRVAMVLEGHFKFEVLHGFTYETWLCHISVSIYAGVSILTSWADLSGM